MTNPIDVLTPAERARIGIPAPRGRDRCRDCGGPLNGSRAWGEWGHACTSCAAAYDAAQRGAPVTFERWLSGRVGHMNTAGHMARYLRGRPVYPDDDLPTFLRNLEAIRPSREMVRLAERVHGEWAADPYV